MKRRLRLTRILLLPVIVLALGTRHIYREDSLVDTLLGSVGLTLLVLAAGGRIWASAYLGGRKNRTLVTSGPFSVVRNPLYFFSFLGFVGAGLAFGSVTMAALLAFTFFVAHWPAIRAEEAALSERFGEPYRRYRERVPRFVPRLGRLESGGTIPLDTFRFSVAVREGMAIPMVFIAAEVIEWAKLSGTLPVLFFLP